MTIDPKYDLEERSAKFDDAESREAKHFLRLIVIQEAKELNLIFNSIYKKTKLR